MESKIIHAWPVFAEGVKVWILNWKKLAAIYLLVYFPALILNFILLSRGGRVDFLWFTIIVIRWLLDALVVVSLIYALKQYFSSGPVGSATSNIKSGKNFLLFYLLTNVLFGLITGTITFIGIIAGGIFVSLIWKTASIGVGLVLTTIAIITCIVGVVYFLIRLSLSGFACVLDDLNPILALKQSHSLIKKYVTFTVAEYCLFFLAAFVSFVPLILLGLRKGQLSDTAAIFYQFAINAFIIPAWACVSVVMYKKLKEANS